MVQFTIDAGQDVTQLALKRQGLASNTKVFFDDADCAVITQQFRNDISEAFAPMGWL